ncbi:hypothetical protein OZL92_18380 [Bacillus sonorensis]|uniref:Phr family secreted Rap phosphatase inhibitor n=1 Tax=Bacillus sonorensis TaxID=119858 RepID=A0ABM6LI96_9BACI|nr:MULTISPECIES: hypothetical protein [Bacillus]TWK84323.1 hypothetical protein CHCC20335_4391 [Bacillus paralicheniformis]ASB89057.1 hypothetical protein S101395_02550 [Bacillus sonorensis]MCZ0070482.1 hypothetical protein [Bacillus sonorensis]MCZ0075157.1 hypothetical protein [Bacillus sonorensis]MCZ0093297.1 hypothetical protein [Bacillus sonorensis]
MKKLSIIGILSILTITFAFVPLEKAITGGTSGFQVAEKAIT